MKQKLFFLLMVSGATWSALSGSPSMAAETSINLCNANTDKIYVAVAYNADQKKLARGWWAIEANKCVDLSFPLLDDRLFLFAQSSNQVFNWIGTTPLCTDLTQVFDFPDAENLPCTGANQGFRSFREISVSSLSTGTAGTRVPTFEFKPADAVSVGGRLKFCNDTTDSTYLSLSQKKSGEPKFPIKGWFMIDAGKCFETRRDPDAEEVYFYVQGGAGKLSWRGDTPLCTDDVKGYSFDDAASMDCKGNNQVTQLFRTERLNSDGFEFRLQVADAHEIRSMVDLCNSRSEKSLMTIAWERPQFSGELMTRGWYVMEAGACVNDLPIDAAEVFIHIEDAGPARTTILEGPMEACIDQKMAFMFSHATQMACNGENQGKARFAAKSIAPGKVRLDVP